MLHSKVEREPMNAATWRVSSGAPCRRLANPVILPVNRYVAGKPSSEVRRELGLTDVVKLASNENPAGPSPRALQAIQSLLPDLHLYPERGGELGHALSERHGVSIDGILELIEHVQAPFSTTMLAHAAALASLGDEQHRVTSRAVARASKKLLYAELSRLGLRFVPSHANFVFVDFETDIAPIANALLHRGFIIRPVLETCARITLGTLAQTAALIDALEPLCRSARSVAR